MRKPQKNTRQQAGAAIHVVQPHTLGVDEAIARLNRLEKSWLVGLTKVTVEFSAGVRGIGVTGGVVIDKDSVTVETHQNVGLLKKPLEGMIRDKLKVLK